MLGLLRLHHILKFTVNSGVLWTVNNINKIIIFMYTEHKVHGKKVGRSWRFTQVLLKVVMHNNKN